MNCCHTNKTKILSIVGPTTSGKTKLSVCLAKEFGGEIINADSMQVYKEMNIGTTKPSKEEMNKIPHHLFGFLSVTKEFNVANYVNLAKKIVQDIRERNKIPIICGGTGLYIDNLLMDNDFSQNQNFEIREKLEKVFLEKGNDFLFSKLYKIDRISAEKLHKNDTKRIIRALEIYYSSGKTKTQHNEESLKKPKIYDVLKIGLNYKDRKKLYKKINKRVDDMILRGLKKEAEKVLSLKISKTSSSAIGYKEFLPYFKNKAPLKEIILKIKQKTRRYAKKQLTWFLKDEEINWIYVDEYNFNEIFEKSKSIINNFIK